MLLLGCFSAMILVAIMYYFSQPMGIKTWIRPLMYPAYFFAGSPLVGFIIQSLNNSMSCSPLLGFSDTVQ